MYSIAVLIPTYMPGDYIRDCLMSLEQQTLPKSKFKVYIALNGPIEPYKENLLNILSDCSFSYNTFFLNTAGVSNARNHLIEMSTEPFITFIDDDDILSRNYLEELLLIASEDQMAISNVKSFKKDLNKSFNHYIGNSYSKFRDSEKSKFKIRKYFSTPWAKMLHREMIGDTRFNTKLSIGEDALFMTEISPNIEAVRKASITAIYYVNQRQGSVTRRNINKIDEFKRITYLSKLYTQFLISGNYDKLFVSTRLIATIRHLKRLV